MGVAFVAGAAQVGFVEEPGFVAAVLRDVDFGRTAWSTENKPLAAALNYAREN
jgi:hypothetical protein